MSDANSSNTQTFWQMTLDTPFLSAETNTTFGTARVGRTRLQCAVCILHITTLNELKGSASI